MIRLLRITTFSTTSAFYGLHIALLLCLMPAFPATGQDLPEDVILMLGDAGDDAEIAELIGYLEELVSNPVNINTAGMNQLMLIPGLRPAQAGAIVAWREGNGNFESVDDLLRVRGIGPAALEQIRPYVTVGGAGGRLIRNLANPKWWVRDVRTESYSRFRMNRELAEGYRARDDSTAPHYLGSPAHLTQRLSLSSRALSLNLAGIKDPGEPSVSYSSWHVAVRDAGPVRTIVAGDFRVSAGYGLLLASGAGMGRVSASSGWSPARNHILLHRTGRYQPVQRGFAISAGNRLILTFFTASNRLSASVINPPAELNEPPEPITETQLPVIRSITPVSEPGHLPVPGFWPGHASGSPDQPTQSQNIRIRYPQRGTPVRTESDRSRLNNTEERMTGGRLEFHGHSFTTGATWYSHDFSHPVAPAPGLHNRHDFSGRRNSAGSVDGTWRRGRVSVFTEAGQSANGGRALLGGAQYRSGRDGTIRLLYRNYGERFQSYYGRTYSAVSGRPRNEEGFLAGAGGRLPGNIRLDGYIDLWRHPGPRPALNGPSAGHERFAGVEIPVADGWTATVSARHRSREQGKRVEDPFGRERQSTSTEKRDRYTVGLTGTGEKLRYQVRMEWIRYGSGFLTTNQSANIGQPANMNHFANTGHTANMNHSVSMGQTLSTGQTASTNQSAITDQPANSGQFTSADQPSGTNQTRENGFALVQDIRYSPAGWIRIDARLTLFETDSFASRLYVFEQDVLYSMSLPALHGTGSRSHLLVRVRPARFIEMWARLAITRYDDRPAVGSGHDRTIGNTRTTLSGVVRMLF
jgi:competence ComEA-like helix-hairpin-helix protein